MGEIVNFPVNTVLQKCLLCDNTRELFPEELSMIERMEGIWVCDDCRSAIIFAKELFKKTQRGEITWKSSGSS